MWARGTEAALLADGDRVEAMGEWLKENIRQLSQLTVRADFARYARDMPFLLGPGFTLCRCSPMPRCFPRVQVLVRGKLSKLERSVIVALVTTDVHARDIVEQLYEAKVDKIANFTWQQQLRYYFDRASDIVVVRQSNSLINYGYEYQGCTSRLVITPLTDRYANPEAWKRS